MWQDSSLGNPKATSSLKSPAASEPSMLQASSFRFSGRGSAPHLEAAKPVA
jgi:hypothetical protein